MILYTDWRKREIAAAELRKAKAKKEHKRKKALRNKK
jgi:hypothetical protein